MPKSAKLTAKAERRKRRKAAKAAAASVEPTNATEAPEPPSAPDTSPEMEVEPAAPDHTANRLLLMTAEHEAAMAALQRRAAAKQASAESEEEIEIKEEMAALTRRVDDYCVRVGDTRRPQGLFGSTVAAKAVVAAADLERTILYGEIVFSESGEWVVPDPPPEEWREYEPAISRDWSLPEAFEVNMVHYKYAIRRLQKAFPALQAASPPTVRPCVCSAGARRWPWELDIHPPTEDWCSAGCRDIRRGQELWRESWIEADTSRWGEYASRLWGEFNRDGDAETEMEFLRHRLARCRKKSGV